MKKISLIGSTILLFLMVSGGVLFNACTKDPCKKIICKNDGICRDGKCKCKLGFDGVNCESKMYERYIGVWDGAYRCNGNLSVIITNVVEPGTKANEINIYNVFNQGISIKAIVSKTTEKEIMEIPSQTVNNITYSGNGDLVGNSVTLFIQELNNSTGELTTCVYNATKFTQN